VVSVRDRVLRMHAAFVHAPEEVQRAIVQFATVRNRARRKEAVQVILGYAIPRRSAVRRRPQTHPDDAVLAARLQNWHARYNAQHFDGALSAIPVHVSRRLRRRLGHYATRQALGEPCIVISRRHIRRDGFASALETLAHEMVHQWQEETGQPVDHRGAFRRKAREIGIAPTAVRRM
jgi:hypothetical protein